MSKQALEKLKQVREKRSKGFIKSLIILTIICTIIAAILISFGMINVFFFLFFALLPTISSILWDRKPGRFASKTVAAFNMAGCSPHLIAIFSSGTLDTTARSILTDPNDWVTIYGFAMSGWGMVYFVPQLTALLLEFRTKFMVAKMEQFQQKLLEEWGEDVSK